MLPLSEECVLVLHFITQYPISTSSLVMLMMYGHTTHQPLCNSDICCICATGDTEYCCQHYIYTRTPSPLFVLQQKHLQLKSIQNTESTIFSMMHLSLESLNATSIYIVTKESTLLLTLHYANCTNSNSTMCSSTFDCY